MVAVKAKLVVDAGHPAVRIEVLDACYRVRASGYGRIEQDLPAGLYTVRYAAADAREERDITLRPGEPITLDDPPELPFASAAPLDRTSTSHEYHQGNAQRLSQAPPLERGHGAELFIFVRDVDVDVPGHPAQGLSLHRADGGRLLRFDQVVEVDADPTQAAWAGRNIALDPGTYLLRLETGPREAVEMAVVVCRDWQSQVFLLRQGGGSEVAGRPVPDLAGATQLMAPPSQGFEPWRRVKRGRVDAWEAAEDLRLAELARQALAHGWRAVRDQDLGTLLEGKWFDPLLGIFGVHLVLMKREPDLDLAERVVGRLRDNILHGFRHPDVEALALEVARRRGAPIQGLPLEAPPLLRRSWQMLVRATAEAPALIAPGSLASRISDRLWGTGAWLSWEVPPEVSPRPSAEEWLPTAFGVDRGGSSRRGIVELSDRIIVGGVTVYIRGAGPGPKRQEETEAHGEVTAEEREGPESTTRRVEGRADIPALPDPRAMIRSHIEQPGATAEQLVRVDFTDLREAIESLLPRLAEVLQEIDAEDLAERAELDGAELAILVQIEGLVRPRRRREPAPDRDPLALATLVERLGLPAERISRAMARLFLKLLNALGPRRPG